MSEKNKPIVDYKVVATPVIQDYQLIEIGERYGIHVNPDDATQYRLCQVIFGLEQKVAELES